MSGRVGTTLESQQEVTPEGTGKGSRSSPDDGVAKGSHTCRTLWAQLRLGT